MKKVIDVKDRLVLSLTSNDVKEILQDMSIDETKSYLELKDIIKEENLSHTSEILIQYLLNYRQEKIKKKEEIKKNILRDKLKIIENALNKLEKGAIVIEKIENAKKFDINLLYEIIKDLNISNNSNDNKEQVKTIPDRTNFVLCLENQDFINFENGKEININVDFELDYNNKKEIKMNEYITFNDKNIVCEKIK